MKCKILHETTGRLRVHLCCGRMSLSQADVLEYYLRAQDGVQAVKVYDRTQDAVVLYEAERGNIIRALAQFSFAKAEAMELVPEHNAIYFGTRSLSWNGIQFLSHFLRSKEKSSNRNTGRRALSMPGTPHCQG